MTDDSPQLRGDLRTLSSQSTEIGAAVQILFASAWTVGVLGAIVAGKAGVGLAMLGLGASAVIWLVVLVWRPNVIETDGYWLLVSDFSKTVWIPLRQIASVHYGPFGGLRVYVEVACDTPFGRQICFEPQFRQKDPVVEELRELVARAKGAHQAVDGEERLPEGRVHQHDDAQRHQAGPTGDRRPVPGVSGAVAPGMPHVGTSLRARGARWRLSKGPGDYDRVEFGCMGVFLVGAAGLAVLTHGPWIAIAIPLVILVGNTFKGWPVTDVETDGHSLFLERRGCTAEVPLTEVDRVEVDLARGYRQAIRVSFRRPTPLGSWVTIEVPNDWMATAYDHRSVRELRALIAEARAAKAQPGA